MKHLLLILLLIIIVFQGFGQKYDSLRRAVDSSINECNKEQKNLLDVLGIQLHKEKYVDSVDKAFIKRSKGNLLMLSDLRDSLSTRLVKEVEIETIQWTHRQLAGFIKEGDPEKIKAAAEITLQYLKGDKEKLLNQFPELKPFIK
jgi:hypothetical protein